MRPSETARGQAWLDNFLAEDRWAATALLDSISFVRLSTMRTRLVQWFEAAARDGMIPQPAVLVPALSLEDIDVLHGETGSTRPEKHVAYETYEVGAPIRATPGSEGFVGNLVRDLTKQPSSRTEGWLGPQSTLNDLRAAGCRSIVLVTDYAGSGTQLIEFARTFVRGATVRSWRSGGFVRIHAVSFRRFHSCRGRSRATEWPGRSTPYGLLRHPPLLTARGIQSCAGRSNSSVPRKASRRRDAFGYKGSRGLFATEAGAPNNLPSVLRRDGGAWRPFFTGRTVPADLSAELGDYRPAQDSADLAAFTGQHRLARSLGSSTPSRRSNGEMLELLAHLRAGRRDPVDLAARTATELRRVELLLRGLVTLDFIDADLRLRTRGVAELREGRRAQRRVDIQLFPGDGEYYPTSMR